MDKPAKEKATELYNKFISHVKVFMPEHAKQCAIICCNELLTERERAIQIAYQSYHDKLLSAKWKIDNGDLFPKLPL